MPTPSIQTLRNDAQQVLNLDSISAVRSVVAATLANANAGTPLNPNLTTQQLWNEFYQIVTQPKSDIESIIANQLMKFLYSPPAPGGAGADKQVIFNDGGVLAGDPGLTFDKVTNALTITGDLTVDTSTLKVDSANNRVGINKASPAYALDVVGNATISATAGNNNWFYIAGNGNTVGSTSFDIGQSSSNEGYVFNRANGPIIFGVNNTTAMTLNSTGLGVGVSPSYNIHARGTTNGRIQVEGASGFGMVFIQGSSGNTAQLQLNSSGGTGRRFNLYSDPTGFFGISDETAVVTRLTIDASGNVGIGVTPKPWRSGARALQLGAAGFASLHEATNGSTNLTFGAYESGSNAYSYTTTGDAPSRYSLITGRHEWYTAPSGTAGTAITWTQAMTLDASGRLLVAKTTSATGSTGCELQTGAGGNSASVFTADGAFASIMNRLTSDGIIVDLRRQTLSVGNISVTTTGATFNSTSDYRLKEAVQPLVGGLARVSALKPSIYKWKADGSNGEGFLAHELAEVVPAAVSGEKDAVNEDGSIKPQGVDMSRVVPVLVAAIQELTARVQTLETR